MSVAASTRFIALYPRRATLAARWKIPNSNIVGACLPTLSDFRWKTTLAASRCPHGQHAKNAAAITTQTTAPSVELVDIPKLPFIGSMIPQYSNSVPYELDKVYDFWYKQRKRFGDFYCIGFPGMGDKLNGETFCLTDPNEYMKVMRKEGPYPFGVITAERPFVEYYNDAKASGLPGGAAGSALFSRGPEWQRIRRFMQSDLLHPSAAKGYVPGMIRACKIASEGAPLHSKNMEDFATYCSFDMFSSIIFGEFNGVASGKNDTKGDREFCQTSMNALQLVMPILMNPFYLMIKKVGIKLPLYTTFEENFSKARGIAARKMKDFRLRKESGDLRNDFERFSYASLAIDRHLASIGEEDALNEEDVVEILVVALLAALDTTSAMANWNIIHLAMNQGAQEELHREVTENIASTGADGLTEACFTKSNNVYLDAVLRECLRMTGPIGFSLSKINHMDDVEIHGRTIPKGSMFLLDQRSVGMDPDIVEDPDVFDPTRWFKTEVQRRKGTPAEILDHPLYKAPFSAGARKCPGSRVAHYETKILLSQLVLDWKISIADTVDPKPETWRDIDYFQGLTIQPEIPELSFERRQ